MRRLGVAGTTVGWLWALWSAPLAAPGPAAAAGAGAAAAEEHRAAVIVDTGTQVKSVCVRFREESITGVEALTRAQLDPVFQAFSGKGAAVCALCGVGCPAGESCLTCNAEGRFWSYSRAPAGTIGLKTSGVGASSTTVRDGDVEGWVWAVGGTPPFAPVEQVCGEAVPVAPSTTTAVVATTPMVTTAVETPATTTLSPSGSATGAASGRPHTPGTIPATGSASTPITPVVTSAAAPAGGGAQDAGPASAPGADPAGTSRPPGLAAAPTATAKGRGDDGAGGWSGLAGFGAVLTGLVAWGARARRFRRRADKA